MTAAARPYQLLPHQTTSSFPFPQEAPNLPLPSSARSTVVSFLCAEGQSQVARTNLFKGHHHCCVILSVPGCSCPLTLTGQISSCFLRLKSFTFQMPFQILRVHRSMSHVLFCFPVAVPTSIAAVVTADIPAMEKLFLLIFMCVCAHVCTCLGKVCGCMHKSRQCRIAT